MTLLDAVLLRGGVSSRPRARHRDTAPSAGDRLLDQADESEPIAGSDTPRRGETVKRSLPFLVMTVTLMAGGYLLTSYAVDMSQMSRRAFGTRGQTIAGGPLVSVASSSPQIKAIAVIFPFSSYLRPGESKG